jgi:asparagine synthase (glutamine-hydrolysing)
MPGLVGLITKMPRALAEPLLLAMLKAVSHEKFYGSGTWIDESLGVYVGWTALKGSFSDGMPLRNKRGDAWLIFSGEEYSDRRTAMVSDGEENSTSSAESAYLIHRHEEDPNFVRNLNGMFHGLIADRSRGVVTLFNDRYGMHRLCYHRSNDAFYFAAEAKAIVEVRPELRTSDAQSLGEFVAFSCILENRTIFKDVQVLPAASAWTFRHGELEEKNTYFDPSEWEGQTTLPAQSYYEELRSVLTTTLPRYFAGPQQIGIAMTGGLDTRVILALHPSAPGTLPSYTFAGPFRESQDVLVGRKVASICGQPHRVIKAGSDFIDNFPDYAERCVRFTEGTVDVSRAADIFLSERAGEVAPVKIVGTYGSEIVRHAVMFKPTHPPEGVFSPDLLSHVRDAGTTYVNVRRQHPVTFAAFRQSPWYHHGILALEQSQITVRSPFMDNEFVRTVYRAPLESASNGDIRLRLINDGNAALGRVPSDRGIGGNGGSLTSAFVRGFQEFTFKAEYAYDYGMPQSVARVDHLFAWLHLERLFLGRHKLLHFRVWYRDRLADYVREMLLDSRTLSRPYLDRKAVEAIVNGHLKGTHNYTTQIHRLLSLELLHRLFLDARK